MDFQALQTELFARGFNHLNDGGAGLTRVKRWLNFSYLDICEKGDWPFLETTLAGAAPLAVSDLRTVESVMVTTSKLLLAPLDRHLVQTMVDPDLTTTGTPVYYYVTSGTTVSVYPVSTGSITVRYFKVPTELSANGDTPVIPARFHEAIVEGALRKAYRDTDNPQAAMDCQMELDRHVGVMWDSLLDQQHDGPVPQRITFASADW